MDKHFWKIEDKISQIVMASHKFTRNKPYDTVLRHFALFRMVREKRPPTHCDAIITVVFNIKTF